jgi:replicative DNA helicase
MVVEKYMLRRMVEGVDQLQQRLQEAGERSVVDFVDQFDRMALGFREMTTKHVDEVAIKDTLNELINTYQNASNGSRIPAVPTGFTSIDRRLGGFRPGELVVIGARPKVGKTTLGINIAQHAALSGYPTGIFSLEMKATELLQRMVSSMSTVPSKTAEEGFADHRQCALMTDAMRRLNKAPLMIRDQFTINIDQIALQCRKWKKTRGLKLVVIDYLQLIDRPRGTTTNEAISEITRKLKNLSGDIETPIILISQLNRLSDTDQRPPRLSDLRDSGSIEQDANLIFLLHPDGKERSKVHVIFAGRRCPSDSDTLLFHREINRFENEPTEAP